MKLHLLFDIMTRKISIILKFIINIFYCVLRFSGIPMELWWIFSLANVAEFKEKSH